MICCYHYHVKKYLRPGIRQDENYLDMLWMLHNILSKRGQLFMSIENVKNKKVFKMLWLPPSLMEMKVCYLWYPWFRNNSAYLVLCWKNDLQLLAINNNFVSKWNFSTQNKIVTIKYKYVINSLTESLHMVGNLSYWIRNYNALNSLM